MEPIVIVTIVLSVLFIVVLAPLAVIAKQTSQNKSRIELEEQTAYCTGDISDLQNSINEVLMRKDYLLRSFHPLDAQITKLKAVHQMHIDDVEKESKESLQDMRQLSSYKLDIKHYEYGFELQKLLETVNEENIDAEQAKIQEEIKKMQAKLEQKENENNNQPPSKNIENLEKIKKMIENKKTQAQVAESVKLQYLDKSNFAPDVVLLQNSVNLMTTGIQSQLTTEIYKSKIEELQQKLQNNINALCKLINTMENTRFPEQIFFESVLPSPKTTEKTKNLVNKLKKLIPAGESQKQYDMSYEKSQNYKNLYEENRKNMYLEKEKNKEFADQKFWFQNNDINILFQKMRAIYECEQQKDMRLYLESSYYPVLIQISKEDYEFWVNLNNYYDQKIQLLETVQTQLNDWSQQLHNIAVERQEIVEEWNKIK